MRVHKVVSTIALFVPLITSALLTLLYTDAIQGVAAKTVPTSAFDDSSDSREDLYLSVELFTRDSLDEVPSCVHSFSSLQIKNTHNSEMVVINSVETKPFRSEGGENDGDQQHLQVHSTFFQDRILKINPKSSVILPLNFFPQIPSHHHNRKEDGYDGDDNGKNGGKISNVQLGMPSGLGSISKTSAVDLSSMLNIDAMDLGKSDVHNVETNVLIQSSRGTYHTKIESSALKHNPFKLPHTIVFERDGYVHTDSIFVDRGRRDYRAMKKKWQKEVGFQYDLYLDNAAEGFLHILEMYPSKPEYVRMQYAHGSGMFNATEVEYHADASMSKSSFRDGDFASERVHMGRFNTCGLQKDLSEFCNVPKTLELTGPLRIAPGGLTAYIGTIVFDENAIKEGGLLEDKEEHFLGYLHIRCNNVFISIALEYLADGSINVQDAAKPSNANPTAEIRENDAMSLSVDDSNAIHQSSSPEPIILKTRHKSSGVSLQKCDPGFQFSEEVKVSQGPHYDASYHHGSVHAAVPGKVHDPKYMDFGLLTSAGQERWLGVSVTNTADTSLKLMHYGVHMETSTHDQDKERSWNEVTERYQRRVASGAKLPQNDSDSVIHGIILPNESSKVIQPGSTSKDFVRVQVNVTPKAMNLRRSKDLTPYQGLVILRFGPADLSFEDWKNSVARDPASAQNFVVEIPLLVHIIEGVIEYNADQTYFAANYSIQPPFRGSVRGNSRCENGFDRSIVIKNNFSLPLTLKAFAMKHGYDAGTDEITPDDCADSFRIIDFRDGSTDNSFTPPGAEFGEIVIRYNYIDMSYEEDRYRDPKKCTLIVETKEIGEFHIPLWVYFGLVSASPEVVASPIPCRKGALYGMDCINALDQSSSIGAILGSAVLKNNRKKHGETEVTLMSRVQSYLMSTRSRRRGRSNFFEPIVISLGAIASDSIETRSLFITNHNPIAINITATVPSIEGMTVRLGQTPSKIADIIKSAKIPIRGGKKSEAIQLNNEWAKMYLTETPGATRDFIKSFLYRDDISLSTTASKTMKKIFHSTATMNFFRTTREDDESQDATRHSSVPPPFKNEVFTESLEHSDTGTRIRALLATADNAIMQSLEVLEESNDMNSFTWNVPPGGVARLEVFIKTPSKLALRGREFAEVVTSGLTLETNLGQFMPIVTTYRALSGKLDLGEPSMLESSLDKKTRSDIISIPPVLRPRDIKLFGKTDEIKIPLQNTFAKNVSVTEIKSCNEWFKVDLGPSNTFPHKGEGKVIGSNSSITISVRSNLDCLFGRDGLIPSFYHCALQWLQKKQDIEENRCSVNLDVIETTSKNERKVRAEAIDALQIIVEHMESRYGKLGQDLRRSTGTISSLSTVTFKKVQNAQLEWKKMSQMGANKIKGVVQAKFDLVDERDNAIESKDTTGNMRPSITTAFTSSLLQTELHIPSILSMKGDEEILRFDPTAVSEVSKVYIPVRNPSGYPISVRLATLANVNSKFFIQRSRSDFDPWWTGKSFYLPDERGAIVLSEHNITIKTQGGSKLSLQSPSLHATSALFHGCAGRRCGVQFDNNQKETMNYQSVLGASAATGVHLTGRLYNNDGTVNYERSSNHTAKQSFALGLDAITEVTLPAYADSKLGPIYFRPTSRGEFFGVLALENSMTGVEVLDIRGQGTIEKIEFFDTDGNNGKGGDIEVRFGKSALMFNDDDKDEYDEYGRAMKSVFVANLGDVPVKISDIYLAPSEVAVNGRVIQKRIDVNKCNQRGFRLLGCQPWSPETDNSSDNYFVLHPNHSKTLHISHKYDCNFKSMYVSLILEYGDEPMHSRSYGVTRKYSELLIGHEMSEDLARKCRSSKMWHLGVESWRKKHEDKNSSFSSFGVYIWTSLVPILIFSAILLDMVISAKQRYTSTVAFQGAISMSPRKQSKSKKTGFKNWSSAYRCLSRADPSSADLIQLGKEQSRQILLNTYKKEGMLQPQCVLPNGTFTRESRERKNSISKTGEGQQSPDMKRHSNSTNKTTLNDAIFSKHCAFDTAYRGVPVMPCGLGWRVLATMRERSASNVQPSGSEVMKLSKGKTRAQPSSQTSVDSSVRQNPKERGEQKISKTSIKIPSSKIRLSDKGKSSNVLTGHNMKSDKGRVQVRSIDKARPKLQKKDVKVIACEQMSLPAPERPREVTSGSVSQHPVAPSTSKCQKSTLEHMSTPSTTVKTKEKEVKIQKENSFDKSSAQHKITVPRKTHHTGVKSTEQIKGQETKTKKAKAWKDEVVKTAEREEKINPSKTVKQTPPTSNLTEKKGQKRVKPISTSGEKTSLHQDNDLPDIGETDGKDQAVLSKIPPKAAQDEKTKSNELKCTEIRNDKKHVTPKSHGQDEDKTSATKNARSNISDAKHEISVGSTSSGKPRKIVQKSAKKSSKGKKSRKTNIEQKHKDDLMKVPEKTANTNSYRSNKETLASEQTSSLPDRQTSDRSFSGLSLTSEDSGSTTSLPRTPPRKVLGIRPPPGFAPPPGFESGPSEKSSDEKTENPPNKTILNQSLLGSQDANPFDDKDDPLLGSQDANPFDDKDDAEDRLNQPLLGSQDANPFDDKDDAEDRPSLGLGQDLNVMNFLNFLDESLDHGRDDDDHEGQASGTAEENNYAPLSLNIGGIPGLSISNNPWSESHTPRAHAYGFDFENDHGTKEGAGNDRGNKTGGDNMNSELLTPAMILGHSGKNENEFENDEDSFDADAFFASLLNNE